MVISNHFQVKIWFIVQLKPTIKNGCLGVPGGVHMIPVQIPHVTLKGKQYHQTMMSAQGSILKKKKHPHESTLRGDI